MRRISAITREHRNAGSFSDLINLHGFVDDGVFLTKSGDLGLVLSVDGADVECLDAPARDLIALRFDQALRLLDDRTRLYQYVLKQEIPSSRPSLYDIELYWVIVAESAVAGTTTRPGFGDAIADPIGAVRWWLSATETRARLEGEIDRGRARLRSTCEAFVLHVTNPLSPRILSASSAFQFFRRLLNYAPAKAPAVRLTEDSRLDFDLADSVLECHRAHLRLDDYYVRVLTLKQPPPHSFAHMLGSLVDVPSSLILASEWRREDAATVRRGIHAKRRHFHNARIGLTAYLGEAPGAAPADAVLVDDSAAALVNELGAALTDLTAQGRWVGEFSLTMVIYGLDPAVLERGVAACIKQLAGHDAQVNEERYNLLNAWLAILPGNGAYNLRRMHLLDATCADCSFLSRPASGSERNAHLGRECLAVLETVQATRYHLNLHVGDVAHTLVLGATGSGKTFLLNFLVSNLQRYSPRTLIFDLGGGYAALTTRLGGTVVRVNRDKPAFMINPFRLALSRETLQFLFAFVKVLIETDAQYAMTRADDQALYEQIDALYQLDADQRRLLTLATILPRVLGQQLQRWVQGGQYADLFDRVDDTVTVADFQCLEFEGLEHTAQLLQPLLFYLLHRATATVLDPALGDTLKVFVLDEAWRFLRDRVISAYVTEALKTWRKKNACVLMATQSGEDLLKSELLRVVIESCPTKLFLANPNIDRRLARDVIGLNDTEIDRIVSLVPRQEILLKQPPVAKVLALHVDAETAALYGASPRAGGHAHA